MRPERSAGVQAAFCDVLADEWARAGVTDAVVAPGSRSTPLVLALDRDPRIRTHVVLDERSAAFTAVGLGLATGRPAVVVTTSGTASVEIHPAVVEAHHAGVPLIAATTDRPGELHQVGAPQTIEQDRLFAGVIRFRASPGVPDAGASDAWRSLASRCAAEALASPLGPGPVHLNLAFREPFFGDHVASPPGRPSGQPWHRTARRQLEPAPRELVELLRAHAGGRGLIIAGAGSGADPDRLLAAARRLAWPVFAEPRSGCRLPEPPVVATADALLRSATVAAWAPQLVVHVGTPWASKVTGQWLASLTGAIHVLVDPAGRWADPNRLAGHVTSADPAALLEQAAEGGGGHAAGETTWLRSWLAADRAALSTLDAELGKRSAAAMSEPGIARSVVAGAPAGSRLMVSSSMPIRDVEWYSSPRRDIRVLSSRGANGIDGVLSTAIGVALADGAPTIALLGDLAFLYDAGALLWATSRPVSLTVVVVDNDGGGIFSFLPQHSHLAAEPFERYWGTPHGLDLAEVARAYRVEVHDVKDIDALEDLLARGAEGGVRLAVIASNRADNVTVHDHLNTAVDAAIRAVPAPPAGPGT
jgi:2-succinyl-5-enolpyruvyl-6-hydroxy-3-cyclohexene-1-carboxylate synthase